MKRQRLLLEIIGGVFLLIIGIIIAKVIDNWPLMTIKYEVDGFNAICTLITLLTTILLAFWVTYVLEKSKENHRIEKDLFITRINDLYDVIDDFSDNASSGIIPFIEVSTTLRRIRVRLKNIKDNLEHSNLTINTASTDLAFTELQGLRTLLTTTPVGISDAETADIRVENEMVLISISRRAEISDVFDKIKQEIFIFELSINNCDMK